MFFLNHPFKSNKLIADYFRLIEMFYHVKNKQMKLKLYGQTNFVLSHRQIMLIVHRISIVVDFQICHSLAQQKTQKFWNYGL